MLIIKKPGSGEVRVYVYGNSVLSTPFFNKPKTAPPAKLLIFQRLVIAWY